MKKNNNGNFTNSFVKKSYQEPKLKKIGIVSQLTQGTGQSINKDNGNRAMHASQQGS